MKLRRYFFGYLFVRIAKVLAILVFLSACGYGVFTYAQTLIRARQLAYEPNEALGRKLVRLREDSERAALILRKVQPALAVPATDAWLGRTPANLEEMVRLESELSRVADWSREAKAGVLMQFEETVRLVRDKLLSHAATLAPERLHEGATRAKPLAQQVAPTANASTGAQEDAALFSPNLTRRDIDERLKSLERARDFLGVLKTSAENPENQKALSTAITELDVFIRLLPPKVEILAPPATPDQPVMPQTAPREKFNAEKVAEQLSQLVREVREAILTAWRLDETPLECRDAVERERRSCVQAGLALKALWPSNAGRIGAALGAGAFAAFVILVFADFTCTLLDTAMNTREVADALAKGQSQPLT